jgi:hypothetical protein
MSFEPFSEQHLVDQSPMSRFAARWCRAGRRPAESADTCRLKSIEAIQRREFVTRDP